LLGYPERRTNQVEYMKKNREFARVLRRLRTDKGISQENLSLEANLARTYISLLERELRSPSLKTINKICEVLEILPSNFMELVEQEKNKDINEELSNSHKNEEFKTQPIYSHLIDIIGNTLNIIVINEKLKISYANQNICDLLGYEKSELLNLNIEEISDPGSILKIKNTLQGLFSKNTYTYSDIICKNKNTDNIHFNMAVIPHSQEAKTALLVLIDATEYKKTQDELLKSQSYLGMALSATKQIVWHIDLKNNVIHILSKSNEHIGYFPKEEIFPFSEVTRNEIHPHDYQKILVLLESIPKHDEPYFEFEYRSKRSSDQYRWNLARCKILKWCDNDRPQIIIGTSFDIDEKKSAQMALALNESRLESLVKLNQMIDAPINEIIEFAVNEMVDLTESQTGLIIIKEKNGHDKIFTNTRELQNHSLKDILDTTLPAKYHDSIFTAHEVFILNQIEKTAHEANTINTRKMICSPIKDHHEVVIISIVNNKLEDYNSSDARQLTLLMQGLWRIIEHKKHHEQIQKIEKNLSVSSRLASMNVLCRCIAHEINNPLSMIQGHSDDLKDSLISHKEINPQSIYQATEQIDKMVERISTVIKGMRTFIQDSTMGFVRNIKINELVENTLNFVKTKLINVDIELIVKNHLHPDQIIDCHPSQIAEVILNLIYNSIDAIYRLPSRWIILEITSTDQVINISITDSGSNIKPDIAKYIFEPFFTTKEDYRGQGLGLYISKTFVEEHSGTIILDETSANTCFRVSIPIKQS